MVYLTTHSTHFICGYMASEIYLKYHSDSESGNLLPAHGLLFVTPVVEHWLEREIAQWVHHEESIRRPIAP